MPAIPAAAVLIGWRSTAGGRSPVQPGSRRPWASAAGQSFDGLRAKESHPNVSRENG